MMDMKSILEIKNLSVVYNSSGEEVRAVDKLSLEVKEGENLGIIGESGCGKSSFALSIMGLLKEAKVTGEVLYKGKNLLQLKDKELKKYRWQNIAIVFQNSLDVLNPVLTVKKQIAEPVKTHYRLSGKEIDKKVTELLKMVGLDRKWEKSYPHQLSGGMRQRVLIAMALACDPEVLLIDEPTASLDKDSKEQIIKLLSNLKKKFNFTSIIISHDMEAIQKLTSRLITMYKGRFIEIGLTEEVIKEPRHCYTRGLLNSAPELFPYKDLWGIKGTQDSCISAEGCAFYPRCPQSEESCQHMRPELEYVGVERMVACNRGGIQTFLKARNIKKTYKLENGENLQAVKGVNIKVRSGEIVALVGKSGSGKSTLAHVLVGVLTAENGQIEFMGKEVVDRWATKMIGGMQIVFQDPFSATSDRLSVMEVVKEPLNIIQWRDDDFRQQKVLNLLKKVQLPVRETFMKRACRNLSGGQRQRVAIARALITEPKLLIADEITSMLDPSIQANIIRQLKGLQNREGFSMLYITHNLNLARKVADKVYVMDEGKIIKDGIASEVFNSSQNIYANEYMEAGQ